MTYFVALLLLAFLVGLFLAGPLRLGVRSDRREDQRRAALEAAKEAKYREIRDAELDYTMGKVGERDYHTTDRELRRQAIEILRQLDELPDEGQPADRDA